MAHHKSNRPPNHHGKGKPPRRKPSNHQRAESKHPQIEINLQNPGGKLYEQKELSLALQVHARTLETDIESRLSHSDISVPRADIPDLTLKSDIAELANTWLPLLDKALFFDLVRRGMREHDQIVIYAEEDDLEGFCSVLDEGTFISLNMQHATSGRHRSFTQTMLGTLAHEMLHAFFHLYSCDTCSHCKKRQGARKGGDGHSGHGPNWCNAMVKVQKAIQHQVAWNVNTSTAASVALEMRTSGWVPRDDQIQRWELTSVDLHAMARNMEPVNSRWIEQIDTEETEETEDDMPQLVCLCTLM
ncbi:uncharacterized protein RSE6_05136 [Rhynchosporium secalis]|uniref:Uncharacterized protein n=1 Tax=Rhynchosporium secalis TaxID=38038 RepID=A0A1E1M711_RHYSE|nr:uncharacterized protein RSE6_05136 [Rhynchosporium secalis]